MNLALFTTYGRHIFTFPHFDKTLAPDLLRNGYSIRIGFQESGHEFSFFFRLVEASKNITVGVLSAVEDDYAFELILSKVSIEQLQRTINSMVKSGALFGLAKCLSAPEARA